MTKGPAPAAGRDETEASMSPKRMLLHGLAGAALALGAIGVQAQGAPSTEPPPIVTAGPDKTGKERLGDKANDEQRVDNCKVPLDRRGPKLRPDACAHGGAGAVPVR